LYVEFGCFGSSAALEHLKGEVMGVTTMKIAAGEGLGFAIPSIAMPMLTTRIIPATLIVILNLPAASAGPYPQNQNS
jgi:tetrahydromethanopterin S-methyltransferase subunit C